VTPSIGRTTADALSQLPYVPIPLGTCLEGTTARLTDNIGRSCGVLSRTIERLLGTRIQQACALSGVWLFGLEMRGYVEQGVLVSRNLTLSGVLSAPFAF
jgi:hypothetical protein